MPQFEEQDIKNFWSQDNIKFKISLMKLLLYMRRDFFTIGF